MLEIIETYMQQGPWAGRVLVAADGLKFIWTRKGVFDYTGDRIGSQLSSEYVADIEAAFRRFNWLEKLKM